MRKEIVDAELNQVTGGETIVTDYDRAVRFTTLCKMSYIKEGISTDDVYDYVRKLLRENPNMSEEAFDTLAREQLKSKGWI